MILEEVWLSYRLSDFVMFSERVYLRQLELHNAAIPGMQAVSLGIGLFICWWVMSARGSLARFGTLILAIAWIWVAWSFLWSRYAEINLLARYAAPAFAAQGLALLAIAAFSDGLRVRMQRGWLRVPSIALLSATLLFYPLLAPVTGRPVMAAEFFALMPDPTALATLTLLSVSKSRIRWFLMVIPVFWCLCSIAIFRVLDSPMFWVVTLIGLSAIIIAAFYRTDRTDVR